MAQTFDMDLMFDAQDGRFTLVASGCGYGYGDVCVSNINAGDFGVDGTETNEELEKYAKYLNSQFLLSVEKNGRYDERTPLTARQSLSGYRLLLPFCRDQVTPAADDAEKTVTDQMTPAFA